MAAIDPKYSVRCSHVNVWVPDGATAMANTTNMADIVAITATTRGRNHLMVRKVRTRHHSFSE